MAARPESEQFALKLRLRGLATSEKQKKTETAYKPEPRKESVPLVGDGFDEYTGEPDDEGAR